MDSKEQKAPAAERSNSISISMRDAVVLPKGSGSFFFHGLYRHQLEASNSLSYGLLGCLRLTILVYAIIVLLLNLIGEPKAMQYMATYTHFIIVIYMFSASIYSLRAWWRQREARKDREYLVEDDPNDSDKEASADLSEKASLVPKPGVPPLDIKKARLVADGAISFRGVIKEADSKRTLGTDLGFWGKLTYVFFQLGFSWSLVVMIMYWSVENPNPNDNKILAAHVHGATFVWMFIDLFFNQIEFVHSHLVFLAITFVAYFTFNGIYSLSVAPIYDVLSWKSASTFPVLLAFIVGFIVAFYFGYVLTRLRDRCTQRHYVFVPVGSKAAPELDDDDDEPCPTPAFFEVNSQHGGSLLKRSARSKNWRKRLALIEGPFLYYYLNKQDYNPRAVLSLVGANAKLEPEVSKENGQTCFSVTCPKAWNIELHEKYYGRTYYFSCESADEARVWVAEIEKSAAAQPDNSKLA